MRITENFHNKFNKIPNSAKRTGKKIALAIVAAGAVIYGGNNVLKDINAIKKASNQDKFELVPNDIDTKDSSCFSLNIKL